MGSQKEEAQEIFGSEIMKQKTALIFGISGQDGPYLCQILLAKGYKVYGMYRRSANRDFSFIKEMGLEDVVLVQGDLSDSASINRLIAELQPDECYNLAAMSHVGVSFKEPLYCADVTGLGPLRLLEAIRQFSPHTKMYQAGSSEEYGGITNAQNEKTALVPKSPYAAAKVFAHHMCDIYRDAYGLFIVTGMLMNHESERRGKEFVTRKITDWIGQYKSDPQSAGVLKLGNLSAYRDWGYSKDYMLAAHMMLQQETPKSYLIGTGRSFTPQDFLELALKIGDIPFCRTDTEGGFYRYTDKNTGKVIVETCPTLFRPLEVKNLHGDPTLAHKELGWFPTTTFEELVKIMVLSDINKYVFTKSNQ
jgi:GDPmannose 4,6-dehydratase